MTTPDNRTQHREDRPAKSEDEIRTEAEQLKETVRERAGSVAETAQEKLGQVAGEAEEQARRVAQAAEGEAREMATERKSQMASQLESVAQAFRSSGDQLRSQEQTNVANYMERAAEEVNHLSDYLKNRNVDEMLVDAEEFARRQPELFLGGAFALGVLAARFFKSSSRPSQQESPRRSGHWQQEETALMRQPRPLPAPEATEWQRRNEW